MTPGVEEGTHRPTQDRQALLHATDAMMSLIEQRRKKKQSGQPQQELPGTGALHSGETEEHVDQSASQE